MEEFKGEWFYEANVTYLGKIQKALVWITGNDEEDQFILLDSKVFKRGTDSFISDFDEEYGELNDFLLANRDNENILLEDCEGYGKEYNLVE